MSIFEDDYYRLTGAKHDSKLKKFKNMILRHNLRFLYWLREAEQGNFLGKVWCYIYSRKYGLEISSEAQIGKGLYLGHPYNITVGSNCVIGNNVNLHKGCSIGSYRK